MIPRLYRLYDSIGDLLYVGATINFPVRVAYHVCSHHNKFADRVTNITLQAFDTRQEALEAEERAIATEKPKYNVRPTNGSRTRIAKALKVKETEL